MTATVVSETYDAVLTTTLRNMQPTLRDNVTRGNRLVNFLISRGRRRFVNGGERIKVPLMYALNSGADVYSGYGQLNTAPQDGITSAFYPWAQMGVPITISGLEEMQNNGAEAVMDLLRSKTQQSEASAMEITNRAIVMGRLSSGATGNVNQFVAIVGKKDNSADGPLPLPALIDADADRSVSIGSINGNTESWWRNQVVASTASSFAGYKQEKNRLYNDCSRGILGNPDLIISDQLVWELYFNSLQSQERYVRDSPQTVDVLGGAAEDMLKFRGAIHIWDEVVPDVGASTATAETENGKGDGVGTYLQSGSHGTEYHLNSQAMEYIVHRQRDWVTTPFIKPVGQDARVAHMLWMGQVVVNNRRKLGVAYDIDNSISS